MGANPNPAGTVPVRGRGGFQGYLSTARLLTERGADANAKTPQDVTPLMMAAAAPRLDPAIVRLLIEKGADPVLETRPAERRSTGHCCRATRRWPVC